MERPCAFSIHIPHSLSANTLIDKGRVLINQTLLNLIKRDVAVTAFNEAHVGIYKGKPKPQIIIFDFVQTLFALFRVVFCDRNFPLQNIQIDQRLKILGQAGGLNLQQGSNFGKFPITGSNGPDDGEVTAGFADFLLQQEVGLIIQIAKCR